MLIGTRINANPQPFRKIPKVFSGGGVGYFRQAELSELPGWIPAVVGGRIGSGGATMAKNRKSLSSQLFGCCCALVFLGGILIVFGAVVLAAMLAAG